MAIGHLRCVVLNVTDLVVAEQFWSQVTGLEVISSNYTGRFSYLGHKDPWRHEVILQLVHERKGEECNRAHPDITVDDVDLAVAQIEAIGGAVKKPPSIYPRPGSFPGLRPVIDWAVMTDPFGNEFCLVSELTDQESRSVLEAVGASSDQEWRAAAGRTQAQARSTGMQVSGPGAADAKHRLGAGGRDRREAVAPRHRTQPQRAVPGQGRE